MARNQMSEYFLASQAKATAAVALAIIAIIMSVLSFLFTLGARNMASQAQTTANNTKAYTQTTVDKALNEANKASSGGGVGPNTQVSPVNTMPNGNGQ
jgi:phenylalanyl-tRNA synthetase beta subunit